MRLYGFWYYINARGALLKYKTQLVQHITLILMSYLSSSGARLFLDLLDLLHISILLDTKTLLTTPVISDRTLTVDISKGS